MIEMRIKREIVIINKTIKWFLENKLNFLLELESKSSFLFASDSSAINSKFDSAFTLPLFINSSFSSSGVILFSSSLLF